MSAKTMTILCLLCIVGILLLAVLGASVTLDYAVTAFILAALITLFMRRRGRVW